MAALQKALLLQRRVVLHHIRPDCVEPTEHRIDIYRMLLYQFDLYIGGFSHRANDVRMFAVERIVSVEVLDDPFTLPKEFKLEDAYQQLFGLTDEPVQRVRLRFSPDVAYLVEERRWHPNQRNEIQKDGSVIVTFTTGSMDELAAWVLSWGQGAKVLEPQVLIEIVKAHLSRALRQCT